MIYYKTGFNKRFLKIVVCLSAKVARTATACMPHTGSCEQGCIGRGGSSVPLGTNAKFSGVLGGPTNNHIEL